MGWEIKTLEEENCIVVYIDIKTIDPVFEKFIDNYITNICYRDSAFSIAKAKKYIIKFINTNIDRKKGAIAEFFIHLYLNSIEMKQKCLFKNLEENSPKKGFDGIYEDKCGNNWFIESKSGMLKSCLHQDKVEEAYRDIKNKFSNNTKNDPWLNAYHHCKNVNSTDTLLKQLVLLSDDYDNKKPIDMKEYNIGPCGTVFDNTGSAYDEKLISKKIIQYFKGKEYKNLYSICITHRAMQEFENYLGK